MHGPPRHPSASVRAMQHPGCAARRRPLPAGLAPGHPESLTRVLPPEQEDLLAAIDDETFPNW
jgi:hypothetical protein